MNFIYRVFDTFIFWACTFEGLEVDIPSPFPPVWVFFLTLSHLICFWVQGYLRSACEARKESENQRIHMSLGWDAWPFQCWSETYVLYRLRNLHVMCIWMLHVCLCWNRAYILLLHLFYVDWVKKVWAFISLCTWSVIANYIQNTEIPTMYKRIWRYM